MYAKEKREQWTAGVKRKFSSIRCWLIKLALVTTLSDRSLRMWQTWKMQICHCWTLPFHENEFSMFFSTLCFKLKLFVPEESFVYDTGRILVQFSLFFLFYHVNNGILIPCRAEVCVPNKCSQKTWKLHLRKQLFCLFFIKGNPKPYEQI
mgnify:CR=1 FL=1